MDRDATVVTTRWRDVVPAQLAPVDARGRRSTFEVGTPYFKTAKTRSSHNSQRRKNAVIVQAIGLHEFGGAEMLRGVEVPVRERLVLDFPQPVKRP
jgi:hypothetical protein